MVLGFPRPFAFVTLPLARLAALFIILLLGSVQEGWGQTVRTWTGTSSGAWLTATNWTSSNIPGNVSTTTNTDIAYFNVNTQPTVGFNMNTLSPKGQYYLGGFYFDAGATTARTINNSAGSQTGIFYLNGTTINSVANAIIYSGTTGNHTFSTSGTALGISLQNATDNRIQLANSGNITITTLISGSGPLSVYGSSAGTQGQLVLPIGNTYTGKTTIGSGGIVSTSGESAFGTAPGSFTANQITFDGGTLVSSGAINFTSNRGLKLTSNGGTFNTTGGNITLTNVVAGTNGVLTKTGTGSLIAAGSHTYTGATNIQQGTLQLSGGSLSSSTSVNLGQASSSNLGTFDLNGVNQTIAGLVSISGTNATASQNTVTSSTAATLTITQSGNSTYGGGTQANSGVITGAISLVKSGAGTLTFAGNGTTNNTYTGTTTISGGFIAGSGESIFGTAPGSFTAAQITLNGGGITASGGNITFNSNRGLTLGASGGTFNTNGNSITLTNVVAGTGALTKTGTGTLSMAGSHSYSGGTVISGGTVSLAAAERLLDAGSITFDGGTFATGGFTETVGVLNVTANGGAVTLSGTSNTLKFANSTGATWGAGTLTISGWVGGYDGSAATGTNPKLYVGTAATHLTSGTGGQLSQIQFFNSGNSKYYTASLRSDGELVPLAVIAPVISIEVPAGTTVAANGTAASFGSVNIGSNNTFTVRALNTGNVALNITGVTIGGTASAQYALVSTAAQNIAAGSFFDYQVKFTPSGTGTQAATLTFVSNSNTNPSYLINISATGGAAPTANFSLTSPASSTLDFGTVCQSATSKITVVLTNNGSAAGTITAISSNNAAYTISNISPALNTSISSPSGTVTFDVNQVTSTPGTFNGASVTISGTGAPTLTLNGTVSGTTLGTVTSSAVSSITNQGFVMNGNWGTAGTCPATVEKGFVYALSSVTTTPTIANSSQVVTLGSTGGYASTALTGLLAGTAYSYRAYIKDASNNYIYSTNVASQSVTTLKAEPTNHVSGPSAAAVTPTTSAITATWTSDNNGTVAADGFLVAIYTGSAPTVADGTFQADVTGSTTLQFLNVAQGVKSAAFTGLSSGTTYNLAIYPYTNSGTGVDYKLAPTVFTAATTAAPATIATWDMSSYSAANSQASVANNTTVTGTFTTVANVSSTSPSGDISRGANFVSPGSGTAGTITFSQNSAAISTVATAYTSGNYFEFALSPNPTYTLSVSVVSFTGLRTTAGPVTFTLYTSTDNWVTPVTQGTFTTAFGTASAAYPLTLGTPISNNTGTIKFRVVGSGGSAGGAGGLTKVSAVTVTGIVAAGTPTPILAITENSTAYASGSTDAYGAVEAGTFTDKTFVLSNSGTATLTISSIGATGTGYAIQSGGSTTSIAAGASANVVVRYTPSAFTTQAGTLDVVSNSNGSTGTYTVNLSGNGAPSANSDIIANAAYTYNNTIDYTAYQASTITSTANSIDIFKFDIRDGGGATDNDALPTILNNISFTSVQGLASIRAAALFSGNTLVATGIVGASSLDFTGLAALATSAYVTAADGGSASLTLRVTFLTSPIVDNQAITVTIASAGVAAAGSSTSSTFKSFISVASNNAKNKVVVTATQIGFVTSPGGSTVGVNSAFQVSVQAQDANGNKDVDVTTGTVTITRLAGTGILTGTTSLTPTAGVFTTNNLKLDVIETGVTLQASISPTFVAGPNVITTASFTVSGIAYTVGCYRTKTSGSTSWTSPTNWEVLQADGVTWNTASSIPDGLSTVVHIERSMTLDNNFYTGSNINAIANKLYVKNGATFTLAYAAGLGLEMYGNDAEFRIQTGSTVILNDFLEFTNDPNYVTYSFSTMPKTTGALVVESGGRLIINDSRLTNRSLVWNGDENFMAGSYLEIQDWKWSGSGVTNFLIDESGTNTPIRTISTNAAGYKFGYLDISATTMTQAFFLVNASPTVKLCQDNLIVRTGLYSTSTHIIGNSAGATLTYGGLDIQSGQFSLYASNTGGTPTTTVEGDIKLSSAAVIDFNQTIDGTVNPLLIAKGDVYALSTSKLFSTDDGAVLQLDGDKTHTLTQSSSNAAANNNIGWQITNLDQLNLASNMALSGTAGAVTVQNGGTLNFSYTGTTPYKVSGAGTTAFTLASGGAIIITDAAGIDSVGSNLTGNVQTASRSFSKGGNYYFKAIAAGTASTGGGLPISISGTLTWEGTTASDILNFVRGTTGIYSTGALVIKQGIINENTASPNNIVIGTGGLTMTGGTYAFFRTGSSLNFPRLTGTYSLTGGTVALSGTTSGTSIQSLNGGNTYYNVTLNGSSTVGVSAKTISSAIVIGTGGTLSIASGEVFDVASKGVTGAGGLTMTGGTFRLSAISTLPALTGTYSLTGGTVELYGTTSSNQQNLQGGKTYFNVVASSAGAINPAGNIDLGSSITIASGGTLTVKTNTGLNMDAGESINGAGNFVMETGTALRFADAYGINTGTATGSTAGHLRNTGSRTYHANATYYNVGNAINAVLGNGIPTDATSLVINRTAGANANVSLASGTNIQVQNLTFSSASLLNTNSDSVRLTYGTGTVTGEAADRYVNGYLKNSRTVAQSTDETFGGIGLTVNAAGAAPGYTVATRRTGTGSSFLGYQNNPSVLRNYNIKAANNTGLNATVTFSYADGELNSIAESLLDAFRSTDNGVTWTRFPAIARNTVSNFVKVNGVPGFSIWTLGSFSSPLPVELSAFNGHLEGATAHLDWQTITQQNLAGFEVQRSLNGKTYSSIGWVATSKSARGGHYTFVDEAFSGSAYYRLQMKDVDGTATFSNTVFLSKEGNQAMASLYPIPAQGALTLRWPAQTGQSIRARLVGVDGKTLLAAEDVDSELSDYLSKVLDNAPKGVYLLHLATETDHQTLRVVR